MFAIQNSIISDSFNLWHILRVVSAEVVTVYMNEVYKVSKGQNSYFKNVVF